MGPSKATRGGRGEAVRGEAGRGRGGAIRPEQNLTVPIPRGRKTAVLDYPAGEQSHTTLCKPVESKTRTYNGRVESGRTAGRRGGVGQNSSPRRQAALVPSKATKTRRLNVPPEARTSEIVCKPMGEQSPRLTRGLSAVHPRFISGTRIALCSWLLTTGPTPICPCKPFPCKACPGNKPRFTTGV